MYRFIMYRKGDLSKTHNEMQANKPDEPQFQGVVFDDGTCVIRWMTACRSTSVWNSLSEMLTIHGHPEYKSELVWLDAKTETHGATPCITSGQQDSAESQMPDGTSSDRIPVIRNPAGLELSDSEVE